MGAALSSNLDDEEAIPYFLWDEPMSVRDLRTRLATASQPERRRLLGKILREARDTDVWRFTTPREVLGQWTVLTPHFGRRREFWEYLLGRWRAQGLIRMHDTSNPLQYAISEHVSLSKLLVDSPEEILAKKLGGLISRVEVLDLVDVRALEAAGCNLRDGLAMAVRRDAGLTPAQLAWVLSQFRYSDDANLPGGLTVDELRSYQDNLLSRLLRLALPAWPTARAELSGHRVPGKGVSRLDLAFRQNADLGHALVHGHVGQSHRPVRISTTRSVKDARDRSHFRRHHVGPGPVLLIRIHCRHPALGSLLLDILEAIVALGLDN